MVPLLGMKDGGGGEGGVEGGRVEGGWRGGGGDLSEPSRPIMILIPRFLPQDFGFKNGLGNLPCRIDRSWEQAQDFSDLKGLVHEIEIKYFDKKNVTSRSQ